MKKCLTFADLFCGIGGFHSALYGLGAECVFASEINYEAREVYRHNFYKTNPDLFDRHGGELFNNDIDKYRYMQDYKENIPDHDILCAGFPCQPFSQVGKKKGFDAPDGHYFNEIANILTYKRSRAFLLENVPHLINHNKGETFKFIQRRLNELDYSVFYNIVKASDFGVPQSRPRLFIVGFRKEEGVSDFTPPAAVPLSLTMSDILGGKCDRDVGYTLRVGGRRSGIDDRHNWDAYRVNGEVVYLTPAMSLRMQGFPQDFEIPGYIGVTASFRLIGNSVAVPVVKAFGESIIEKLTSC